MKTSHTKGIFITIMGVILLSLESLLIKLSSINSLTFSFYISLFVLISTTCILKLNKKTAFLNAYRINLKGVLLCGFLLGISNIFFIASLKNTTVANAVLIFSTAPILASCYMYLLFKEKSSKNIYVSSFFILIGLSITFLSDLEFGQFLGNIYAAICISLFSLAFVLLSRYKEINTLAVISFSSVVSAFMALILDTNIAIDTNNLYIVLVAGLIVSPLAKYLMGIGTKIIPASEVSLLMIIETVMAPIWVWIFLNEIPNNHTLMGGIIILVTLVVNSLYSIKLSKNLKHI